MAVCKSTMNVHTATLAWVDLPVGHVASKAQFCRARQRPRHAGGVHVSRTTLFMTDTTKPRFTIRYLGSVKK
jgi:hypothetical protein